MIGGKIRSLRLAKNLKPAALAQRAGISRSHLGRLESAQGREQTRGPSLTTIQKIASALEVTSGYLLETDTDWEQDPKAVLRRESCRIFCNRNDLAPEQAEMLLRFSHHQEAPVTVDGWQHVRAALAFFGMSKNSLPHGGYHA